MRALNATGREVTPHARSRREPYYARCASPAGRSLCNAGVYASLTVPHLAPQDMRMLAVYEPSKSMANKITV